jgi:hypothetical protein
LRGLILAPFHRALISVRRTRRVLARNARTVVYSGRKQGDEFVTPAKRRALAEPAHKSFNSGRHRLVRLSSSRQA